MILQPPTTTGTLHRRLWIDEWEERLHAADGILLWLRIQQQAADPRDSRSAGGGVDRLERMLGAARDHFFSARQAPADDWVEQAIDCELDYRDFIRESNRAVARFK